MRPLRYAFDEATASLWRGRQSGFLSIGTIAVAMFVLGGLLMVTHNLERLADEWSRASEMSVYLHDDSDAAARESVEQALAPGGLVERYEFVSKDEALIRFKQTFSEVATTIETLGDNPLPASYEARLQIQAGGDDALNTLVARLRALPAVADVRYDRQWLDRLLAAVRVIRTAGLVLSGVLVIAAALTVANVVRLALVARRDELEIMHLVGAPQAYVRGPFIMEGILQGGAGAVVALLGLGLVFVALNRAYLEPLAATINLSAIRFLSVGVSLVLIAGGMLVGCLGGLLASRRS